MTNKQLDMSRNCKECIDFDGCRLIKAKAYTDFDMCIFANGCKIYKEALVRR